MTPTGGNTFCGDDLWRHRRPSQSTELGGRRTLPNTSEHFFRTNVSGRLMYDVSCFYIIVYVNVFDQGIPDTPKLFGAVCLLSGEKGFGLASDGLGDQPVLDGGIGIDDVAVG